MTGPSERRAVQVIAPDNMLVRALAEHRPTSAGWNIAALTGPVDPDALVVIDLDGDEARDAVADRLRDEGFMGPVLAVGGHIQGSYEALPRPVRLGALLQWIDALAAKPAEAAPRRLGPYEFAFRDSALRHGDSDAVIRLTELECKLLEELAAAGGELVTREQLLTRVWGYNAAVDTHTVETNIWRLRQKIETDDPATRFLVTEAGGYRLVAEALESG